MRLVVALLAALLPALASAQITGGLIQPATSVAMDQSPAAAVVNPAGLGFQRGFSLRYLHNADNIGNPSGDNLAGNGLYFALGSGVGVGASLSFEWLGGNTPIGIGGTDHRTTWGLALGGRGGTLGGALHLYGGESAGIDSLVSGDLGLMLRPSRHVSVGFVLRDVGAPKLQGETIPRDYALGIGFRPVGDFLTLAVDADMLEKRNQLTGRPGGWNGITVGGTLQLEFVPGLYLLGRIANTSGVNDNIVAQAGLGASFDHLGLASGALFTPGAGGKTEPGILVAADLSTAMGASVVNVHPHPSVAVVDVTEALSSPSGLRIFPGEPRDQTLDAITGLMAAARNPGVDAIVLKMGTLTDLGFGRAFELRQAVLEVRSHGKYVIALLSGASDVEYYLASAADKVWCLPESALLINGLKAHSMFFGKTLTDIGVTVEAVRIGKFKNAPDELIRNEPSPEQKEVTNSLLDSVFSQYVADVSASRKISKDAFKSALNVGILTPERAKELGLVDAVVAPDEIAEEAGKVLGGSPHVFQAELGPRTWKHWGEPPVIAVIPVKGLITMGHSDGDPFGFVETTGAETVVKALEEATADWHVGAIVMRIDSGGGDSQASDIIYRAVEKARKKKPVFASMGDVAASGGYYAAAGAQTIYAAPTTITGSIGIFALKPAVGRLLGMIDVGTYSEKRGDHAGITDIYEPWTAEEREAMQTFIASGYKHFVDSVAKGRALTPEQVDAVGQGRVWTGQQAQERKLVDNLGGLAAALDAAGQAARIDPDQPIEYRVLEPSAGLLSTPTVASYLPGPIKQLVKAGIPAPLLVSGGSGLWALLPWQIQID